MVSVIYIHRILFNNILSGAIIIQSSGYRLSAHFGRVLDMDVSQVLVPTKVCIPASFVTSYSSSTVFEPFHNCRVQA